jgi:membrane-associated phospholipid phosphatase
MLGRSRRQMAARVSWPLLAAAAAAVVVVRRRDRVGLPRPATAGLAASVPAALAAALPRTRWRSAAVWAAHMWAYKMMFELPYDRPDWLRRRVHIDYPIRTDRLLCAGRPAGQRLQRALRRPPDLTVLDYVLALFYATWEIEPHLVLGWILWRHEQRFPGAAIRLAAVFDCTLIGYWLVPTAPPWWASEMVGRMDGDVRRVVVEVKRALLGRPRPVGDHEQGANPWAAMPSDHFASALMTAIVLSEVNRVAGMVAYGYALVLAVALVYLGEHYVTDLLAGGALVLGVRRAAARGGRLTASAVYATRARVCTLA